MGEKQGRKKLQRIYTYRIFFEVETQLEIELKIQGFSTYKPVHVLIDPKSLQNVLIMSLCFGSA